MKTVFRGLFQGCIHEYIFVFLQHRGSGILVSTCEVAVIPRVCFGSDCDQVAVFEHEEI